MPTESQANARALLVKALRSGEYKQTQQRLQRKDGSCCCLGVATLLYQKEVGGLEVELKQDHKGDWVYYFNENAALLNCKVADWLGFTDNGRFVEPEVVDGCSINLLTELNDRCHYDFNKIADVIEKKTFTGYNNAN